MSFNWAEKTAPSAPEQPLSLGDMYRAHQASKSTNGASGSFVYSPEYQAAINGQRTVSRPDLYQGSQQYQGLQSYSRTTRSKHEPRDGESAFAYLQRVDRAAFLQHMADELPEDEFARVQAAVEAARQKVAGGTSHEQLRQQLDSRTSGTGIGLMGVSRPTGQQRSTLSRASPRPSTSAPGIQPQLAPRRLPTSGL